VWSAVTGLLVGNAATINPPSITISPIQENARRKVRSIALSLFVNYRWLVQGKPRGPEFPILPAHWRKKLVNCSKKTIGAQPINAKQSITGHYRMTPAADTINVNFPLVKRPPHPENSINEHPFVMKAFC
jgi:hypothetical protein